MTPERSPRGESEPQSWREISPYAALSVFGFLGSLSITVLLLANADKLVALGLVGNFYFIALVPLGLSAAAFLFGALRSYATYSGKHLGGLLELGGPIVGFVLVLFLGFHLLAPASNFPFTIYVHGANGPGNLILRSAGQIMIDTGGARTKRPIGADGEALFLEIPANFRDQRVPVALDADGFELADQNQEVQLSGNSAYIEVRKKAARISGHVHDDRGNPLAGAKLSVGGQATLSNASGDFELTIPGDQLRAGMTLSAELPGFAPWADKVEADSNDVVVPLQRRR